MKIMIRFICFLLLVPLVYKANAQEIVNLVLVGDDGITEDVQKAHSFIVVKKYPEAFQRLDYGRGKPLQLLRTYSDSTLTVLQGDYFEYDAKGHLIVVGKYEKNQKHNKWYYYNDTGKVKKYETYDMGVLIKETNPDTIKKEEKIDKVTDVEVEAEFQTGQKGWIKYLTKNLNGDLSAQSVKGGMWWYSLL